MEKKTVNFISLGCPRNLVDSEYMIFLIQEKGYALTIDLQLADFIIVNTCGFIKEARDEAIDVLTEVFDEKKSDAKVIVAGCMVQLHKDELTKAFPDIHCYLGSGDVNNIIKAFQENKGEIISNNKSFLPSSNCFRTLATPEHYAYVKIAEGCRKKCSYCIIPDIKGPLKSRSIDQVVEECKSLLSKGVKELILIAQDLGDFGKDKNFSLEELLTELMKIKGDFWFRLMYLYPDEISDGIIKIMKKDKRICPYLDMPIQHVNDRILNLMRRRVTKQKIIDILTTLRKEMPEIIIRTSLMVGFPSETEQEFQELVDFIKKYPFDNIGIFTYSNEKEAFAYTFKDQINDEIKEKRKKILSEKQKKIISKRNRRFINKKLEVIIENTHEDSTYLLKGRYQGQAPDIDGTVIINDIRKVKEIPKRYLVKITDVSDYDLIGTPVKPL